VLPTRELIVVLRQASVRRSVEGVATSLLGRSAFLELLRSSLAAARAGRGALVWVSGEAGIGKTRLLAEFEQQALGCGALVLRAAGWKDASTPAFWLWTQVLREASAHGDPVGWDTEARALVHGAPTDADPAGRFPLFDAVTRVVGGLAADQPVVLLLDDVQWADLGSLRLLRFLTSVPVRVLVACAWRTGGGVLPAEADELVSKAVVLDLHGLDQRQVAALIEEVAAVRTSEEEAAEVTALTRGNPLFVIELARLAASRGSTAVVDTVTTSAYGTIQRRVARVSQAGHELLSVAAVCGPESDLTLVSQLLGWLPDEVARALDEAEDVGLLSQRGGRLSFTHALVRDAVYDALAPGRRRELHLAIAGALATSGGRNGQAAELAHHLTRSMPLAPAERVVAAAVDAAAAAVGLQAYEEAADLFGQAICLLAPDDPGRLELLLARGESLLATGDLELARPAYLEAAELARRTGDADGLARAALGFASGLSSFEVRLQDSAQLVLLREALERLPGDDSELRALLLARFSIALSYDASTDDRAALAEEAVAMAGRLGLVASQAQALSAWCDAHAGPADADRRERAATDMLALARQAADRPTELLALRHRVLARLERGELHRAGQDMQTFARTAADLRQPLYKWYVPLWRGYLAQLRGDLDETMACADEAQRIGAQVGSANSLMLALTQRCSAYGERLQHAEIQRVFATLVDAVADQVPVTDTIAGLFPGMPEPRRRAVLPQLAETLAWLPVDAEWLNYHGMFALSMFEGGDEAEYAALVYQRMSPHASRHIVDGIGAGGWGSAETYLGMLAALMGNPALSEDHFARGLTANTASPLHTAGTYRARGIARLRRGEPTATADLTTARNAYRAMRMEERTEEMSRLLGTTSPDADAVASHAAVFARDGEVWRVEYTSRATIVKHSKGMTDLARLLSKPNAETHVLDLVGTGTSPGHDAGPVLDDRAKAAYRKRLAELEEAAAAGDEAAAAEREALVAQLAAGYGLGGRERRTGATAERARSAVTLRIKDAISRIEKVHPELGRHLRASVRTGVFCSYAPEHEVAWTLESSSGSVLTS
jgi:tetratricopeptide (TPR) repeat protein